MAWIKDIDYPSSKGKLRRLYDRIRTPEGHIDHILLSHALRPHTLEGHMALYKNVLHHKDNTLPKWFLESIGVWVSNLNRCSYCVEHHTAGLRRLLGDSSHTEQRIEGLMSGALEGFDEREQLVFHYARLLTCYPERISESDIKALKDAGYTDGEILEINQVTAYFAYANRTVLGLGVTLEDQHIGLSPGAMDEADNWTHS